MKKVKMGRKILIVEDNNTLRDMLYSWLNELYPDCKIYLSASGEDGLVMSKIVEPDIMIVDIKLPGINGLEVTRNIKESINAKVIILTMMEGMNYQNDAYAAGAELFINKKEMHTKLPGAIQLLFQNMGEINS